MSQSSVVQINRCGIWHWDKQNDPKCSCYSLKDEHIMYVTRCKSPGRQAMLRLSVRDLTNWMSSTGVDSLMVDMIESYLLAQDSRTMLDCLPYPQDHAPKIDLAGTALLKEESPKSFWSI